MPLYEYRCTRCGHSYDKIQKFSDELESVCPECGGELMRPLSAPAFQFKGAGWYVNDYAPKPASGSSGDKAPAETASGGDAKPAEAKPAESTAGGESKSSSAASDSSSKPSSTSSAE